MVRPIAYGAFALLVSGLVVATAPPSLFAGQTYSVVHLGRLPGPVRPTAGIGVNEDRQVAAGWVYRDGSEGFVWDDGRITQLSPDYPFAAPFGINNNFVVAGIRSEQGIFFEAVLWHGSGITDIHAELEDVVPGGVGDTWAMDANDDDLAVGFVFEILSGRLRGYMWQDKILRFLDGTNERYDAGPYAVNAHGDAVGEEDRPDRSVPLVWRAANGWEPEELTGFGPDDSAVANDLNDAAKIVGHANTAEIEGRIPFLWDAGEVQFLDRIPGHGAADAFAINARSQIVGESCEGTPHAYLTCTAVLWDDRQLVVLDDRIPNNPDWHLEIAYDINDRGDISGTGLHASTEDLTPFLAIADLKTTAPGAVTAGEPVTFALADAEPGSRVGIFGSPATGTTPVPDCPADATLDLVDAKLLASGLADADGSLELTVIPPPGAAGRSFHFQAASREACMVGNRLEREIR